MFVRLSAVGLAVLLLAACEEPSDQSKQAKVSVCKGLSETDCAAETECVWNTKKAKCKKKEAEDTRPESNSPQTH